MLLLNPTSQLTGGGGMKKLFVFLCIAGLIAASASPLLAGGIENKHNWCAEWVRSLNRNAATDSADAVSYNPAGVMKMDGGFYLNVAGQYALKDYSNTFLGTEYNTDEPDFVPSLFALYKQDKWAAYGAVTIVVAGGKIDYEQGDTTTFGLAQNIIGALGGTLSNHHLEGEAYSIGYTIGGAYAINDMVSVSLGARFVDASREFKGYAALLGTAFGNITPTVDYEETGDGWGGIIIECFKDTEIQIPAGRGFKRDSGGNGACIQFRCFDGHVVRFDAHIGVHVTHAGLPFGVECVFAGNTDVVSIVFLCFICR